MVSGRHNKREREFRTAPWRRRERSEDVPAQQQPKPSHATVSWPPAGAGLSKGGVTVVGWLVSWLLVASHFKEN